MSRAFFTYYMKGVFTMDIRLNELKNIINKANITLELKGIICFKDYIDNPKLSLDKNYLWISCNKNHNIGINRHQIVKIQYEKNAIIIYLDQLLQINITIHKEIF